MGNISDQDPQTPVNVWGLGDVPSSVQHLSWTLNCLQL